MRTFIFWCFFGIATLPVAANVSAGPEEEMVDIQTKLKKRQEESVQTGKQLNEAVDDLGGLEQQLSDLNQALDRSKQEKRRLATAQNNLNENIRQQEHKFTLLTNELDAKENRVWLLLRQGWRLNLSTPWRSLLTPHRPDQMARQLGWLGYLVRLNREEIKKLKHLKAEKALLIEQNHKNRDQQALQKEQLEQERQALAASEGSLKGDKKSLEKRIANLKSRQTAIEKSISDLSALIEALQSSASPFVFDGAPPPYGALPWPVVGEVVTSFDDKRSDTDLPWQGILITATVDAAVRAVHPGQVVYSGSMQGWDSLVIVGHQGGFFSLYGYNHKVNKKTGEFVEAGEVLATLAEKNTNWIGRAMTLFFAIYLNDKPMDPDAWLSTKR